MEIYEKMNASSGFFYTIKKSLASKQTPYQKAELMETEAYGKALLLDGRTQVIEHWEYRYHEPLVHPVMLIHPHPTRALLIGGGDGGALREMLRYKSVESVDFVELDPDVVAFSQEYLPDLHQNSFSDPRVSIHYGDGRAFVEDAVQKAGEGYDIIIMDMTDPVGPALALYTVEFFSAIKQLFKDTDSCFAMHGESPATWPEAYACIGTTLSAVFAHISTALCFVPMYGTLWSFRYASNAAVPRLSDCDLIEKQLASRLETSLRIVTSAMWPALFAEDPIMVEAAMHPTRRIIRDADPTFPGDFEI